MIIYNYPLLLAAFIVTVYFLLNKRLVLKVGYLKKYEASEMFLMLCASVLFLVAGFRGDFSRDYRNYVWYYTQSVPDSSLTDLIYKSTDTEYSFAIICKLFNCFDKSVISLMFFLALIEVGIYYFVIKKYSKDYLVSLLLFVVLDNYLIFFILMKNFFACALFFLAVENIYKKKPHLYILEVLLISTVHQSALLLLPMYCLLRFNFFERKNRWVLLSVIFGVVVIFSEFYSIVFSAQKLIGYNLTSDSYGVSTGSLGSLLKTIFLFFFVILLSKHLDYKNITERVWMNGCCACVVFQLFAYRMFMMQRFAFYFSGFFILLIPLLIYRSRNTKLLKVGIVVFVLVYALIMRKDDVYYTFFNNQYI